MKRRKDGLIDRKTDEWTGRTDRWMDRTAGRRGGGPTDGWSDRGSSSDPGGEVLRGAIVSQGQGQGQDRLHAPLVFWRQGKHML